MDGIFGVGLAEIVIVMLAMFVIGGPKNTAKWARQMGAMIRKARQYWAQMMAELEADIGPEGKEIMDAARELSQGARQVSNMSPQKRLLSETMNTVKSAVDLEANTSDVETKSSNGSVAQPTQDPPPPAADSKPASDQAKYNAWTPPDD